MTPEGDPGVSDFGISAGAAPHAGGVSVPPHQHADDPRYDLAAAIRRVTTAMIGANLNDGDIKAATATVTVLADALERSAGPGRRPRAEHNPAGHPQDFFPTSPAIGFANPLAPPVVVEATGDELRGSAYFDYPYEGPPSCVHGGVLALVLDELLGAVNIVAGNPGMTGTLTIRYRKPTPLRTPLRLVARSTKRQGRKIYAWGGVYHGEVLTAEAEGTFVELVPRRFLEMVAADSDSPEAVEQVRADVRRLGLEDAGDAGVTTAAGDPNITDGNAGGAGARPAGG